MTVNKTGVLSRGCFHTDLSSSGHIFLDEKTGSSWIQAMRPGDYQHPFYGLVSFTQDRLRRFADNIKSRVRGIDLAIDYDHRAKSGEAAGWVKDAKTEADGSLWLFVEWTQSAFSKIKEQAYRYFSPEFADDWTDAQGNTHKDVLLGGGITNRPYLKDLVPINLSELSFDHTTTHTITPQIHPNLTPPIPTIPPLTTISTASGNGSLTYTITVPQTTTYPGTNTTNVTPPTSPKPREAEVDLKKLAELLGLPADSSEEQIVKFFSELRQPPEPDGSPGQGTTDPNKPGTNPADNPPPAGSPTDTPPAPPPPPNFQFSEDVQKLAEVNPDIKALMEHLEYQKTKLNDNSKKLREAEVTQQLNEFDRSKFILTPKAKDIVQDILLSEAMTPELNKKFWELLNMVRSGKSVIVELGERAATASKFGRPATYGDQFEALAQDMVQKQKIPYADAVTQLAKDNPKLFDEYRQESTAFYEN